MIDKQTADLIKDRADIVEVVGDYVQLIRRGSNYMGLCPFHSERTPSFSVNKRKNFCYCFSCHKGGSPVNFIMEKEGVSYHDALLILARKYGIQVEERELNDEEIKARNEKESLRIANQWALERMKGYMHDTEEGRAVALSYFRHRGVTDEAIQAFALGYSPEASDTLVKDAQRDCQSLDALTQVGLIGHRQRDNKPYDRFYSRVIFPIHNPSGVVVGFGGRDIKGESKAKYINSPESPVYDKSRELYGIFQAKSEIRRQDCCYLVEGYMDVIGMWQSGVQNVVASSGTSLTESQLDLILRYTRNLVIIYDGDSAGIKATIRAIDMALKAGMQVSTLLLPDGHDPDSFAREHTADEFREYIAAHSEDFIDYKRRVLIPEGMTDPMRRAQAIRGIIDTIACIPDGISRTEHVKALSHRMNIDADVVMAELSKTIQEQTKHANAARRFEQNTPQNASTSGQQARLSAQDPTPAQSAAPERAKPSADDIIHRLERETLRYAVAYGMVEFCDGVDEEGNTVPMNVANYIRAELEIDGLDFSDALFSRTFREVLGLSDDYATAYAAYEAQLQADADAERQAEYQRIAEQGLNSDGIKLAEDRLERRIEEKWIASTRDFASQYAAERLASDPDDDMRRLVTDLIMPRYTLSTIYEKRGNVVKESDRLIDLVPRALSEWKTALLEKRIAETRHELAEAVAAGHMDAVADLQKQLTDLFDLRRGAVQNIGDRILNPRG